MIKLHSRKTEVNLNPIKLLLLILLMSSKSFSQSPGLALLTADIEGINISKIQKEIIQILKDGESIDIKFDTALSKLNSAYIGHFNFSLKEKSVYVIRWRSGENKFSSRNFIPKDSTVDANHYYKVFLENVKLPSLERRKPLSQPISDSQKHTSRRPKFPPKILGYLFQDNGNGSSSALPSRKIQVFQNMGIQTLSSKDGYFSLAEIPVELIKGQYLDLWVEVSPQNFQKIPVDIRKWNAFQREIMIDPIIITNPLKIHSIDSTDYSMDLPQVDTLNKAEEIQVEHIIEGNVIDSKSREGIGNALIRIGPSLTTYSDDKGAFSGSIFGVKDDLKNQIRFIVLHKDYCSLESLVKPKASGSKTIGETKVNYWEIDYLRMTKMHKKMMPKSKFAWWLGSSSAFAIGSLGSYIYAENQNVMSAENYTNYLKYRNPNDLFYESQQLTRSELLKLSQDQYDNCKRFKDIGLGLGIASGLTLVSYFIFIHPKRNDTACAQIVPDLHYDALSQRTSPHVKFSYVF